MSEANINLCGFCGHEKINHIYEEGACRPGFVCQKACKAFEPMSEPSEGPYKFNEVCEQFQVPASNNWTDLNCNHLNIAYAQGQASKEARVKELEEALDLVIPRCVKCFNYATKFNPKKLWPVCDYHVFEAGGATAVINYRNAIKATEALKKLKG